MFDNICNFPLTSDLISQAVHPSEPLFSVGLSAGHVQTFRLPPVEEYVPPKQTRQVNASTSPANDTIKSALSSNGRRLSQNGLDMVDTAWRTHRHKGSCRALTFSRDGSVLFSAGTDGLVKAAASETGRVTSKIAMPLNKITNEADTPSLIHCLSPQSLLLGTDSGRLHVYDLRAPNFSPSSRPVQTVRPHVTEDEPDFDEPLTSLAPLPPTAASTSGTSKAWVTTAGATVAVSDLRKGVVTVSVDQKDELLCSTCVGGKTTVNIPQKRTTQGKNASDVNGGEKVVVGGARGVLTVWERGSWEAYRGRVVVHKKSSSLDDDGTIDALAVLPEGMSVPNQGRDGTVAAGLGNGQIRFIALRGWGGRDLGKVGHDDHGVEGVSAIGFDIAGRMISGGGPFVKVWHPLEANAIDETVDDTDSDSDSDSDPDRGGAQENLLDSENEDEEDGVEDYSSVESGSENESEIDEDELPESSAKRQKKSHAKQSRDGQHGIRAFIGLD